MKSLIFLKPHKVLCLLILSSFFFNCKNEKSNIKTSGDLFDKVSDEISVVNFDELEPFLYTESDKIHIINFWAMWCAPCVKELPYIEEYAEENPNVKVLLVSLDFPKDIETKLKPFLKKNNITPKVMLLDDPDSNTWIDKIDPNWSGAIPFTIIFNKDKRVYLERSFESLEDLKNEINKNFNQ